MSMREERLQDILSHVAAKCDVKNWHYKKEEENGTLETYFGILIPVTLVGIVKDKELSQRVFVKLPTVNKSIMAFSQYLWDCEAYVYNTLVPMWKRFSNLKIDEIIPLCYYSDATPSHQTIVLKDMRYEGYQTYKGEFLDFEHVMVSLKTLAQFHALSIIVKNRNGELDADVLRPYSDTYPPELNKSILNSFRSHFQLFKGSKYERYWETSVENYKTIAKDYTSKAKCLVYGHGDYSKENIIYKYKVNRPVAACLLDFQTCQLMTPAHDFLSFILITTNGNLRRLHYETFLTEYYASFKDILLDHDIDLESFYKKEDFISDLKSVATKCFIRICLAFSLWLGFECNTTINSKNSWDNDQQKKDDLRHFKQILIDAMDDLCSYGYISL